MLKIVNLTTVARIFEMQQPPARLLSSLF